MNRRLTASADFDQQDNQENEVHFRKYITPKQTSPDVPQQLVNKLNNSKVSQSMDFGKSRTQMGKYRTSTLKCNNQTQLSFGGCMTQRPFSPDANSSDN
jgi:hypothetical protein